MKLYVCKLCGRSMIAEEQPVYCYFDRMEQIEQLAFEEAEKFGYPVDMSDRPVFNNWAPEFPAEVRYDIFTGKEMPYSLTLADKQNSILRAGL